MRNLLPSIALLVVLSQLSPAQTLIVAATNSADRQGWNWTTPPGTTPVEQAGLSITGAPLGAWVMIAVHAEVWTDDAARVEVAEWYARNYPYLGAAAFDSQALLASGVGSQISTASEGAIQATTGNWVRVRPDVIGPEVVEAVSIGQQNESRDTIRGYAQPVMPSTQAPFYWERFADWWGPESSGGSAVFLRKDESSSNARWNLDFPGLHADTCALPLARIAMRAFHDQMTGAGIPLEGSSLRARLDEGLQDLGAILTFQAFVFHSATGGPIINDPIETRGLDGVPSLPPDLVITQPVTVRVRISGAIGNFGPIKLPLPFEELGWAIGGRSGQVMMIPFDVELPPGSQGLAFFPTSPNSASFASSAVTYLGSGMGSVSIPNGAIPGIIYVGIPPSTLVPPPPEFDILGGMAFTFLSGGLPPVLP